MQTQQEIISALQEQFNEVNNRLAAIDKEAAATAAQYREQRSKVAAEAAPLAKALAALGVKVTLPGVASSNGAPRKPMSDEAKARIAEGLRKARERKLAAQGEAKPVADAQKATAEQSTPVANVTPMPAPAAKKVAAKKVGARA